MIHVIATIELREGSRAAFLEEFQGLVPEVRAEPGCIEYGAAVDATTTIARQACRPETVVIIEKWASLAHLEDHLAAPHMAAYRERIANHVTGAELRILDPAD